MVRVLRFVVLGTLLVGALVSAPGNANAATVSITADYARTTGAFDPAKYLNANEGGYKTHNALTWLPESYPAFRRPACAWSPSPTC